MISPVNAEEAGECSLWRMSLALLIMKHNAAWINGMMEKGRKCIYASGYCCSHVMVSSAECKHPGVSGHMEDSTFLIKGYIDEELIDKCQSNRNIL